MAKGDGSISQLGRNHWKVRVDFGTDPVTHERHVVSKNVRGSKADAVRVRDQLRSERDNGIKPSAGKITLSEFIIDWADARRTAAKASERTIKSEQASLRHVERHLGHMLVKDIDPQMIERVYALIRNEGKIGGTTLNKIHIALKSVFKKAIDYGLILRNPCDHVDAPRRDKPERRFLSQEEFAKLLICLDKAESDAYESLMLKEVRQYNNGNTFDRSLIRGLLDLSCICIVRIARATGMRRGEILALTWDDFDSAAKTVCVSKSLTNEGEVKTPKTKAGIRTLSIDSGTLEHLEKWKLRQGIELRKLGIAQSGVTPIACSNAGTHINASNFEHWWKRFRIQNGFDSLKLHELRHTQASLLIGSGVDVKTVVDRLGHASAQLTLDWYSHALPENDAMAALCIENLSKLANEADKIVPLDRKKTA